MLNNTKKFIAGPLFVFVLITVLPLFLSPCMALDHSGALTTGAYRYKLPNGLTVILKQIRGLKVCAVQVWLRTGSANETDKEAGITHLIEHMIFKGTEKHKTGEIARAIESAGGQINAYTSYDRTVYHVEILNKHLDTALDILLDAVQHSTFDPVELAREKEVVLEEYRRSLDSPTRRLAKALMRLCYKRHPYRRPVIGFDKTIRSFNRADILSYIDRWYTPKNMLVVVVGDFPPKRVLQRIKALTMDFPHRHGAIPHRPAEPAQHRYRQKILKQNVKQAYLSLSWHIPAISSPDTPALDVLEVVLGHSKTSRLYQRLKATKNLVHEIDASAWEMLDSGLFSIDATLRPNALHDTLSEIAGVIKELQSTPVRTAEIEKAKRIVEADFLFSMETASGQASTLGFFETMTGDMRNSDLYLRELRSVSPRDLMRVARAYFRPSNMSLVAMVPQDSALSVKAAEIEKLFPSPTDARRSEASALFGVPRAKKIVLKNGIRVIIKENHRLPIVSITAAFLGGTRLEPKGKEGISNFVAEMLPRGTSTMTSNQIAMEIDSMGGRLEPFSGRNSFGISSEFLSRDLARALGILANILCDPTFPKDEIEKVRSDILQTIRAKQDRPTAQLFDLFYTTLYKKHPYGHPSTGSLQSIKGITRKDLLNWYKQRSDPSNLVISVVGDIHPARLGRMLEARLSDMPSRSTKPTVVVPEHPLTSIRQAHVEKDSAQINFIVGFLEVPMNSPLNAAMELIDTALSGQGGRLFYRLRDKQGLAYAITSFRRPGLETGAFGIYMGCAPEKFPAAKEAVFKQIQLLRDEGLSAPELNRAKEHLLGTVALERQTNSAQALNMALNELYGLGYDYEDKFIQRIKQVTINQIRQAAKKVFTLDRYVLVSVGPQAGKTEQCEDKDSYNSVNDKNDTDD